MLRMGAVSLRASRKGVVSLLVARRRGRTMCEAAAGESSRKGHVLLPALGLTWRRNQRSPYCDPQSPVDDRSLFLAPVYSPRVIKLAPSTSTPP
jgi:hypothetical protein